MRQYEEINCKCGKKARIVECGIGVYIRCPFCDRGTYMVDSKEKAIHLWE